MTEPTTTDPLADDWAKRVRQVYPELSPDTIDALRCAYTNGGAFAMLGILTSAQAGVDA
jgi:hypothetical protein